MSKECPNCNEMFKPYRKESKYCSKTCYNEGFLRQEENRKFGNVYTTTDGTTAKIVEFLDAKRCHIELSTGQIVYNVLYKSLQRSKIKNPYHPTTSNKGFMGQGVFDSKKNREAYKRWAAMIDRCYNKKTQEKHPTYKDVAVCEEWHNFQNFAVWFYENYKPEIMEKWQLDKDILVKENKIYSPEMCTLIPKEINSLILNSNKSRGKYPIGVAQIGLKYIALVRKYNKSIRLGLYATPEEAFQVYKAAKEQHIKKVAEKWKDLISSGVYEAMCSYKVEITD